MPIFTGFTNAGAVCASCKLYTYTAGTTTAATTYSDVSLTVANTNPIVLDSSGRAVIFLAVGSYKFILKTAADVTIWTADNITSVPSSNVDLDITGTAGETLAAGDTVYLSDGSGSLTVGRWYKTDADFIYASTAAGMVGVAPSAITSGQSGSIRLLGRVTGLTGLVSGSQYYASATAGAVTATAPTNARFLGTADSTTTLIIAPNPARAYAPTFLPADGRLTAETAVCVSTTDQSAKTNLFYTPCVGNRIALYDGTSSWTIRTFSEITIPLTGCTISKPYDVFLYDNNGTVAAETLVWTNTTTRATALVRQDGVWVKTGATTRRYVGSFFCNSTGGQTDDTAKKRYIWNANNRARRPLLVTETTDNWTYSTATWHQANASALNQVELMAGLAESAISLRANHTGSSNGGATSYLQGGIGEDATNALATGCLVMTIAVAASIQAPSVAFLDKIVAVGVHNYPWLELASVGANVGTFFGDNGQPTIQQNGLTGSFED